MVGSLVFLIGCLCYRSGENPKNLNNSNDSNIQILMVFKRKQRPYRQSRTKKKILKKTSWCWQGLSGQVWLSQFAEEFSCLAIPQTSQTTYSALPNTSKTGLPDLAPQCLSTREWEQRCESKKSTWAHICAHMRISLTLNMIKNV